MAERRRGLGRGLGALIPSTPPETDEITTDPIQGEEPQGPHKPVSRETENFQSMSSAPSAKDSTTSKDAGRTRTARKADATKTPKNTKPKAAAGQTSRKVDQLPEPTGKSTDSAQDSTKPGAKASGGVSRETSSKSRKRSTATEARQKAMKARMEMGAVSRRAAANRPSDMFFTPTPSENQREEQPQSLGRVGENAHPGEGFGENNAGVSRETDTSLPSELSVDDGSASHESKSGSVNDLPDTTGEQDTDLQIVPGATFVELDVQEIHPNRKQPRQVFDEDELEELAYSIRELGVLQPVVVRVSRETGGPGYELVMGERRWRATQQAGLERIPAIVRETSDNDLLRDALLENLHRSQLNPLEEAAAYQQLMDEFGASQEELSRRIGRSRPQISNTLRLLRLPALVQRRVAAGVLSAGHARALLALEDPAEMERLAQRIVAEGLSVRATEEAVTLSKRRKPTARRSAAMQERHRERLDYIADAFADKLDTSVKINLGARKGKMTIEFASVEDLNRIISVLDPDNLPENQD